MNQQRFNSECIKMANKHVVNNYILVMMWYFLYYRPGVHKFSNSLVAISKLKVSVGLYDARSIMRNHKYQAPRYKT
jgi:hypothetical protein